MAWLFQGVLNAGLQILLSIAGGWLCARLKLVDPEVMSRNLNAFAMKAAYPAFILHLLGVKTDLRDGEAWRALGVFVLWVLLIHLACLAVHKLRGPKRSSVMTLGLNCLLLSTNNTGCIGWPVLIATVGPQSAVLSMLLGLLFFIQLLPVTISCFEYNKWEQGMLAVTAAGSGQTQQPSGDACSAASELPVAGAKAALALPAPDAFPHEFRYCYWSCAPASELFQSSKSSKGPYAPLSSSGPRTTAQHPASCIEVYVDSGGDDPADEAACHHCFGGGTAAHTTPSAGSSYGGSRASSSCGGGGDGSSGGGGGARQAVSHAPAAGREWWRSGPPRLGCEGGGLKRAKDSCDSLYTPFAAAACAEKQQQAAQLAAAAPQVPRPATLGLSTLTRRLSRGLGAAGAAAASAAGAAVAATHGSLARAASLHTAGSLKKVASLKKAASMRRSATAAAAAAAAGPGRQQPSECHMSVPLMAEHSDAAPSCCPSHAGEAASPRQPAAAALQHAEGGGLTDAALAAAIRLVPESTGTVPRRSSSTTGGDSSRSRSSSSGSSNGSSTDGGAALSPTAAAAAAAAAARGAAAAGHLRLSRLPGAAGLQGAADSAVELHTMCDRLGCCSSADVGAGACSAAPAAAGGDVELGSGDLQAGKLQASGSSGYLEDRVGRFDSGSGTSRINSRTQLLSALAGCANASHVRGTSKLSRAAGGAAAAAVPVAGAGGQLHGTAKQQQQQQRQQKLGMWGGFVRRHPLLCHIASTQLQSFHLWLNVVAIALSVSGARVYLDPTSPQAIPALGFVDGVLSWFSAACIPTLLFANGVWMCGKDVLCGGWRGQVKVLSILLLKLTLLPALMIGLTLLCGVRGAYGLSLVLLASCPLAPLAFLVCQQYNYGAELATAVTIQGVLLMLPQMMAVIKLNQLGGLYDVALVA